MGMADVEVIEDQVSTRKRSPLVRVAAFAGVGVLVVAGVLVGGTAYADAKARSALDESRVAATNAIAQCEASVAKDRTALMAGAAAALDAAPVADRVTSALGVVNDGRDALREAANGACSQTVGDAKDANMRALEGAEADTATVKDLATQLRGDAAALRVSATTAKLEVAREGYTAKSAELAKDVESATASAASMAGQVVDQAALDALNAAIIEAKALVDGATNATDVAGFTTATQALDDAMAKITDAATAAVASHQAWLDAQAAAAAAAAAAGSGGSSGHSSSGGHTSGGSSGGSTGGGSTGGGSTGGGGAGVVTWGACDGEKQDKYIDGEYAGNRGCTTVAFASAAVAPYQNPGNGTCAVVGSRTSDSTASLVSKASQYTYGRFTFSQVNDYQVKMTIESCLAP